MKIIAITQARSGSTRLPNKILKTVQGKTLLETHLHRLLQSKKIDQLIVATTIQDEDMKIKKIADAHNLLCYRGSVNDVLDRFYQAVQMLNFKPDYIVRVTSDCPLIDAALVDEIIAFTLNNRLDYCSNTLQENYPDGMDAEVFTFAAIEKAWEEAKLNSEREHVTPYIRKNSSFMGGKLFPSQNFCSLTDGEKKYFHARLTVDEEKDFQVIAKIILALGIEKNWKDYAEYYLGNKEIQQLNGNIVRNEGYLKSLREDKK